MFRKQTTEDRQLRQGRSRESDQQSEKAMLLAVVALMMVIIVTMIYNHFNF